MEPPKSRKMNPYGNGIGLSICKQICEGLGGNIKAKSQRSGGCTFKFTMKVYKASNLVNSVPPVPPQEVVQSSLAPSSEPSESRSDNHQTSEKQSLFVSTAHQQAIEPESPIKFEEVKANFGLNVQKM